VIACAPVRNIKTDEEYSAHLYKTLPKTYSQIARSIIPTVDRLGSVVADMKDYDFTSKYKAAISDLFAKKECLVDYTCKYLTNYFKLLAVYIANQIWVVYKTSVDNKSIESTIRLLDIGNHDYLVASEVCVDGDKDLGLTEGVLEEGKRFFTLMNPAPTEEEKEKSKKKGRKKAVGSSTKSAETSKTSKAGKAGKGAADQTADTENVDGSDESSAKDDAVNAEDESAEAEEDAAEAEEDQEEAAEAEEEVEDGAEDVEEEAEEETEEAEEEPEPTPKKKNTKKSQ
jgi:hypothetical protein